MKGMKRQRGNGGIGIFGLLGAIFITLKILDVKPIGDWSWLWVTSPIWISMIIGILVLIGVIIYKARHN